MGEVNAQESLALQKFRERVGQFLPRSQFDNDLFLIRWLRARDLNVDKAEAMLRNVTHSAFEIKRSIKWRVENKVDLALERGVHPYFTSNFPFDVSGRDKEGRPLLILPLGKWDVRLAVESGRVEELPSYINYFFEKIMKALGEATHNHCQFTSIVDWDGYSFTQFTNIKAAQAILQMSAVYEAHYPEVLHRAFFINCTPLFQLFFALMKKVLAERTVAKIQTFGTKRSDWQPQLSTLVNLDQLNYDLKEGSDLSQEELLKIPQAQLETFK